VSALGPLAPRLMLGVVFLVTALVGLFICSAAFVTPVSSPTNMLVMEPGGYAFGDYVKVGLPMLLLTMLATVALARVIYLLG
jgi:di/tricarboxylate transporter